MTSKDRPGYEGILLSEVEYAVQQSIVNHLVPVCRVCGLEGCTLFRVCGLEGCPLFGVCGLEGCPL